MRTFKSLYPNEGIRQLVALGVLTEFMKGCVPCLEARQRVGSTFFFDVFDRINATAVPTTYACTSYAGVTRLGLPSFCAGSSWAD